MKKGFTLFLTSFIFLSINAQKKEVVKDTVKTEVVNIVTKYNPKIADAKKIKKNPKIKLLKKNNKKKLKYTIFSAPVASTFIPKSGGVKGIDIGVKERIYKNYVAAGFGNYTTPFFDAFLHHSTRFKNEIGFYAKYLAAQENIENSILNTNFSNFNVGAFYKKYDRYFDWKVSLNSERDTYNWYGLPKISFTEPITNTIIEEQVYNYFELIGEFDFTDSYIDYGRIKGFYFTESFNSSEIFVKFDTKIDLPLTFLNPKLNDISIKTSAEYLKGEFKNSYKDLNRMEYSTTTIELNPEYKIKYGNFLLKTGIKLTASFDNENDVTNSFILPDVYLEGGIVKNYLNIYGGVTGDLKTNTYKGFSEENPYISPTLLITQTLEKLNLFVGFNGKINNNLGFNIKASYKKEEDKPLFLRNASKSDGTNNSVNGTTLKGYEYGNSFNVYYDDVKTTSIFTEIEYDYSNNLSFGLQGTYNIYKLENATEAWNLPTIETSISTKYKKNKWFANADVFYVSERKDGLYSSQFPSAVSKIEIIDSFVDVNVNGGYHFNDKFSTFIKLNNILNTDYQRFANFNTQGFQILGGIAYKFDL
ncbi:hypothetical protein [uncultured Polaribacter sp.]|uniref:hypothetical protein n=1 Tax=uncultured Polaribacter sp. TaxID=174711 RepID=UPI0026350727|nr:hypothetical protein [uncultured Polaribacter sp.]